MELFTATGKLFFFFLTTSEFRCVHHWWHGTHRYDIQVLATYTRQHDASIFFTATMIRVFRLAMSHGNGGTNNFVYFASNARCAVTTDLLMWYSNTQNEFSPAATIFSLHTLASPSGRNVNYDENQLSRKTFLSYSFYLYRNRKYLSYGFPIINVRNPGEHYETPCIYKV